MAQGKLKNLRFKEVKVRVLGIGDTSRVLISWELFPTAQDLTNLKFFVDRGESPTSMVALNTVGIAANTLYEYLDTTTKLKDNEKFYYYRVRAVEYLNTTPIQTFTSESETWEGTPDLVALYIIEEHDFAYRYVHGVPCLWFKKMKEGARCNVCWDPVLKRVTKSKCSTCNGTGFIVGYHPPMEVWVDVNPDPKMAQIADFGERQPSQTDMQFTNYPLMTSGDLLVELEPNRYWSIANVRNTEKNRTTILQTCRLNELNRSDVEYSIVVPDEVRHRLLDELDARDKEPEF